MLDNQNDINRVIHVVVQNIQIEYIVQKII